MVTTEAIAKPRLVSPAAALSNEYAAYLADVRGCARSTIKHDTLVARCFVERVLLQLRVARDNQRMRKRGTGRNPLFAKRWFADEVMIMCVRWYLRFRLSYRDLASIAAELGVAVAPSTILRWVIRYTGEFVSRWSPFQMVVGRSWRAD